MNPWGSKHVHVADAKNWIKTLMWKVCISLVYVTWFITVVSNWFVQLTVGGVRKRLGEFSTFFFFCLHWRHFGQFHSACMQRHAWRNRNWEERQLRVPRTRTFVQAYWEEMGSLMCSPTHLMSTKNVGNWQFSQTSRAQWGRGNVDDLKFLNTHARTHIPPVPFSVPLRPGEMWEI
jgi:hypothetical protein